MVKYLKVIIASLSLFYSMIFSVAYSYDDLSESITVLAPTSFSDVMTKLVRIYSLRSNSTVSVIFDSPSNLVEIVESGDQADIIITDYRERNHISEDATRIDDLQNQGLVEIESKKDIAQGKIALVAARNNPISKKIFTGNFADILDSFQKDEKLIIPDYDVEPSGIYIKEALITSGNWKSFESRIIKATSNKSALHKIIKTSGVGFVYSADILNTKDVVIVSTIPSKVMISNEEFKYHEPIVYRALVVAGKHMVKARKFITFLESKEVKQILRKHKFETVN